MDARRPRSLEFGLFLLIVAAPLVFTPFTAAPFMDAKLLLVAIGALALCLGGVPVDRRLLLTAAAWVAVTAIATLTSVNPLSALSPTITGGEGGLIVTAAAATAVVVGAGLPGPIVERLRGWLGWTGVAIAGVVCLHRLAPQVPESVSPRVNFVGATLGSQLVAATFLAAAMAAVAGDRGGHTFRRVAQLVAMTVAVAITGERSSLVLPLVAVGVALWRSRASVRRWAATLGVILTAFVAWHILDPSLPGEPAPASAVEQLGRTATDAARGTIWRAGARAWAERPLLGWGPNTTRTAYVWAATPSELELATRRWNDGHDLFLETAVGSGILGVLPLIALLSTAVVRALRSSPDRGWAVGAAAAIGAYSLVEPVSVTLTPMLFLFAGIGAWPPRRTWERSGTPTRGWQLAGFAAPALLTAAVAVAALQLTASALQQRGRDYADEGAFRLALQIQPWRLSAQEYLALQLAVDGRSGNEAAASEARTMIASAVAARPWDTDVRHFAADINTLVGQDAEATRYLTDQLDRFPNDVVFVADHRNAPPIPPP